MTYNSQAELDAAIETAKQNAQAAVEFVADFDDLPASIHAHSLNGGDPFVFWCEIERLTGLTERDIFGF